MPGGRGRGGPLPREVQVSKALSKLLRHSAEKEGLQLDAAGYINLKDVVGLIHAISFLTKKIIVTCSLFQPTEPPFLPILTSQPFLSSSESDAA